MVALSNESVKPKSILWTKNYIVLTLTGICSTFSFFMILSIFPKYLTGLGISLTLTGVIVGTLAITALIIRPFTGFAADKYNKKVILMTALAALGICLIGYAVTKITVFIFMFRILNGLTFAISGTVSIAWGSEYIPKDRMGEGIGYYSFIQFITAAITPGLGIILAGLIGYPNTFILAGLIAIFGALICLLVKSPAKHIEQSNENKIKFNLKNLFAKEAVIFSVLAAIVSFSGAIVTTFLLLVAIDRHVYNIGIYFFVGAFFMFLTRPLTGKMSDRKGLAILVFPSIAVSIISMILHGISDTLWLFLLAGAIWSFAQGCMGPALQAECIRKAGKNRSGVANSTYYMGLDIAQGTGPVIGGIIASLFSYAAAFYFAAFLLFAAGILFYFYNRNEKKQLE